MKNLLKTNLKNYSAFAMFLQIMFFLFALVLVIQAIRLQVFESGRLKAKASHQRQIARPVSFRGIITDRNSIRLASDITIYDIYAHPTYYHDTPVTEMASILAKHLKKEKTKLFEKLSNRNHSTITIAKNVDFDLVEKKLLPEVREKKIKGLDFVKKSKRVYPQGYLASHILGYTNFDANILAGVEKTASKNLEEMPEVKPIEYDGRGNVIYDVNTDPKRVTFPPTGKKLVLTIDSTLQHLAETELEKGLKKTKAERGTVIILNPKNGDILAFAVLPNYNPAKYNTYNPSVVKNWALSDVYPPGSTFKILTVASALESGYITPYDKIYDSGIIKIDKWPIKNHDYKPGQKEPGLIDLKYLFAHSSNVGSLKVALKIPKYEHYKMLKKFNIGYRTGIDLPGESYGILPKPKTWNKVRQATIGYGYSIATTPIQIASAVGAIANKGVWVTPHVIKYKKEEFQKKIKVKRVISKQTARVLTNILADSIDASTSKAGKIPNYRIAGKSGTSRKPKPNGRGYLKNKLYTSFVGYLPVRNPQFVILVVIDSPNIKHNWGSTVAGPVFNSIALQAARLKGIEPDRPLKRIKEILN